MNDKLYVCIKPGFHVAFNESNWQLATDKLLLTTVMHFKDSVLAEGVQINSDGVLVNLSAATEIDGTPQPPVKPVKYKSLSYFNDMTPRAVVGFKMLNVTISDPVELVDVVVKLHVMNPNGSIKSTHDLNIASRTNGILDAFPDNDIPCGPNEYFGISLISPTEKDAITSFMGANKVPGKYVVNGGNVFLTLSGDTPETTFDLEVVTQKYQNILSIRTDVNGAPQKRVVTFRGQAGPGDEYKIQVAIVSVVNGVCTIKKLYAEEDLPISVLLLTWVLLPAVITIFLFILKTSPWLSF